MPSREKDELENSCVHLLPGFETQHDHEESTSAEAERVETAVEADLMDARDRPRADYV